MSNLVNLSDALSGVNDYFSPKVIEEVNSVYIKVAKILGEKVPWHTHDGEDEMFHVLSGKLKMEVEGMDPVMMGPGDIFVVKAGLLHRVSSEEECHIILIENKETQHTGSVESEITKSVEDQLQ
ncbi:MAG: cupin domain-containing protein [Candidatus Kariarchaeaceae archaeon]|jgi:quercetin dioxygenase-like cupin family protein